MTGKTFSGREIAAMLDEVIVPYRKVGFALGLIIGKAVQGGIIGAAAGIAFAWALSR